MDTFRGLPLHPLVVHAVVVLLPLTALCVVLHALWPVAARRLGIVTPILAVVCLVLVPIATSSGESLASSFGPTLPPLVARHKELAERLLPWTIALTVTAIALYAVGRWGRALPSGRWVAVGVSVVALVAAVGTAYTVVQVGEAGARAVWSQG
jgi:hypothetical protein